MKKIVRRKPKLNNFYDIEFTFKYVNVNFKVDESYNAKQCKAIRQLLNIMSEQIVIDKSYVEFKENKHTDTFMTETGWNELCELVISTNFGKKTTYEQTIELSESYCMMVLCYAYQILEKYNYDTNSILLYLPKDGTFMVEFKEDTIHEWKTCP